MDKMQNTPTTKVSRKDYYLNIANAVSKRSTCLRRQYGAIIVKNDEIISTGYNGAPRGQTDCFQLGKCNRDAHGCAPRTGYEYCPSVHAEMNAVIHAARKDSYGGTLYIVGTEYSTVDLTAEHPAMRFADPCTCTYCKRMMLNAGIADVYGVSPDGNIVYIDIYAGNTLSVPPIIIVSKYLFTQGYVLD